MTKFQCFLHTIANTIRMKNFGPINHKVYMCKKIKQKHLNLFECLPFFQKWIQTVLFEWGSWNAGYGMPKESMLLWNQTTNPEYTLYTQYTNICKTIRHIFIFPYHYFYCIAFLAVVFLYFTKSCTCRLQTMVCKMCVYAVRFPFYPQRKRAFKDKTIT